MDSVKNSFTENQLLISLPPTFPSLSIHQNKIYTKKEYFNTWSSRYCIKPNRKKNNPKKKKTLKKSEQTFDNCSQDFRRQIRKKKEEEDRSQIQRDRMCILSSKNNVLQLPGFFIGVKLAGGVQPTGEKWALIWPRGQGRRSAGAPVIAEDVLREDTI